MADIVERLRKQLEVPASLMGGETFILKIEDVREATDEIQRLRLQNMRLQVQCEYLMDWREERIAKQ